MSSTRQLVRAIRPILFMIEDRDSGAVIGASVRGSAFVVDAATGLLGTAKHVVKGISAASLRVRSVYTVRGEYALGLVNTVQAIYEHPTNDFAVVRVSPHGTKGRTAPRESAFSSDVGDEVAVFGFASGTDLVWCDEILGKGSPKSLNPVVFHGRVAALVPDDGRTVEVLVYDATTFSGDSGGPVVSVDTGAIVGLHLRGTLNQLGFGLPIVQCSSFIADVVAGKAVSTSMGPATPDGVVALKRYVDWENSVNHGVPADECDNDVQAVLMDALNLDEPTDLLTFDWEDPSGASTASAIAFIRNSASARPVKVDTLTLEHSIMPAGVPRKLEEVRLKAAGEIWEIHRNDADPFPSNPHAHNVETGLKLDLATGDLYRRAKKLKEIVAKKELLVIRELATSKGIEMPELKI